MLKQEISRVYDIYSRFRSTNGYVYPSHFHLRFLVLSIYSYARRRGNLFIWPLFFFSWNKNLPGHSLQSIRVGSSFIWLKSSSNSYFTRGEDEMRLVSIRGGTIAQLLMLLATSSASYTVRHHSVPTETFYAFSSL